MKRHSNDKPVEDDLELLAAISLKAHGALEALMKKYRPQLFNIFQNILKNKTLAEDAWQVTWMKLLPWLANHTNVQELGFNKLLTTTAFRVAVSIKRKEHREHRIAAGLEE